MTATALHPGCKFRSNSLSLNWSSTAAWKLVEQMSSTGRASKLAFTVAPPRL